jgi:hypothetical protein
MNRVREERALRKQVLQARSGLHRVEIRGELRLLKEALGLGGAGAAGESGFSLRGWLRETLLRRLVGGPAARLLGILAGIASFVQVLRIAAGLRGGGTPQPDSPHPPGSRP